MENEIKISYMPVVPMRGMVVFPNMMLNFDAGRDISIKAIEAAGEKNSNIFLTMQENIESEKPGYDGVFVVGTVCRIKQIMRMPGNIIRVVVKGIKRGILKELTAEEPYYKGVIQEIEEPYIENGEAEEAYINRLKKVYDEYFSINTTLNVDSLMSVKAINDLGRLCDAVASGVESRPETKQNLLEEFDIYKRSEKTIILVKNQIEILKIEKKISKKVKDQIDKNQKEYYMREQLKVIHEELGDSEGIGKDVEEYKEKIKKCRMKKETAEKLLKDIERFSRMGQSTPDSNVLRSYLDTVFSLPWNKSTKEIFNIKKTEEILDEDHYGLEKVKERAVEYLAVRHMTKGKDGTVLCFVGPPGVGKTSVAKSIARALGRKYVRISLGGIHDEADIRGHRKTYIGAMEGRVMAAMKEAGVKNPLILLDEIDKMGTDYKGDPSAALLEVLDYEQNNKFRDHYIEVPFDLSQVLFITTANSLDTISRPLLDRMEIIELSGYTEDEKFNIAKKYLLKKSFEKTGLNDSQLKITDGAIHDVINYYTKESGVRKLEQKIGAICRKAVKILLENGEREVEVNEDNLSDFLGKRRYHFDAMNKEAQVGVVRGLAWTAVGGDTLTVEANVMDGKGKIELTGKLGDVMKESAVAAISYIRSNDKNLGIDGSFYKNKDIHIHVPEGAVPKDGPSAGITMATAVVSSLVNKPVRNDIAMTGEITIRGRVLPIGGLKEKSIAAYRAGIRNVIIPEENKPDIDDIPKDIREKMNFITVQSMDTVLKNALVN